MTTSITTDDVSYAQKQTFPRHPCTWIHTLDDCARLQTLFEKLSQVFKGFSEELDKVVAAVNDLHDEVRETQDRSSAFFRMKKDQAESVIQALQSVIFRFREQEVPFEQETRPVTESHLREFRMAPNAELTDVHFHNLSGDDEPSEKLLCKGTEVSDVEKAVQAESMTEDLLDSPSLRTTEINEENNEYDEKDVLLEVKQRKDELLLLEQAVSSLNSLHEHLNFLVHTQDLKVNRIDSNISQALEYTEKVRKETDEAVELYQQASEKSVLLFLLIAVLLLVLLLVLSSLIRI